MAYVPDPISTEGVKLEGELAKLAETLARNTHENWAQKRMAEGWKLGPERSDSKHEHPGLVPFEELPEEEKEYDRHITKEALKALMAKGYRIEGPEEESLSQKLDLFRLPPDIVNSQDPLAKAKAEARIKELLEEFRIDVGRACQNLEAKVRKSADEFDPDKKRSALSARDRATFNRYAWVDALAIHYRDLTNRTFRQILLTIFSAMLVYELFTHIIPEFVSSPGHASRLVIVLYPLLWGRAFWLWIRSHHKEYQRKYNDYRALAEALRVQFFWDLLGFGEPVHELYLKKQQGELEWICKILEFWHKDNEASFPVLELSEEKKAEQKEIVRRRWVQSQLNYFKNWAGPRDKRRSDKSKRLGLFLLGASLALSLALAANEIRYLFYPPADPDLVMPHAQAILIFFIGTLLTGAALVTAFGEKMAFLEHVRQYDVASKRFADCDKKISEGSLTSSETQEFKDLGKDALQENGDWLLLHRDRPLEVIVP